jgi:hypothetical protein
MNKKVYFVLALPFLVSACQQTKYNWGDYSSSLYDYYKDPKAQDEYVKSLAEITDDGTKKVPPGIYAEYGYEELRRGNTDQAVALFQREKAAWPESTVFMDKAIANAHGGAAPGQKPSAVSAAAPEHPAPTTVASASAPASGSAATTNAP